MSRLVADIGIDEFLGRVPGPGEENGAESEPHPVGGDEPETSRPSLDIVEFLSEDEAEYDWLVPGLLERMERVIATGPEGGGKSTLLRQFSVQCGAGVHPFTLDDMDPVRVLIIDLENSRRHLRRELRRVWLPVKDRLDPAMVRVCSAPAGINLLDMHYLQWLDDRLEANKPELVVMGPLYKMASGDPISEEVARSVALALDRARDLYQVAFFLEAHSPYANGTSKRPTRPYGASLWSRWPEFGIHLAAEGPLTHWRGARDEREWPPLLSRGGEWPWTAETDTRTVTFAMILEECRGAGRRLSLRELEGRLPGCSKMTISRAIKVNQGQFDEVCGGLDRSAKEEEF